MRPELVSRLEGNVPRCSALPRVELPSWPAVSTPAVSPWPAYSVSVRSAPPSAPDVDVELWVPRGNVTAGASRCRQPGSDDRGYVSSVRTFFCCAGKSFGSPFLGEAHEF